MSQLFFVPLDSLEVGYTANANRSNVSYLIEHLYILPVLLSFVVVKYYLPVYMDSSATNGQHRSSANPGAGPEGGDGGSSPGQIFRIKDKKLYFSIKTFQLRR